MKYRNDDLAEQRKGKRIMLNAVAATIATDRKAEALVKGLRVTQAGLEFKLPILGAGVGVRLETSATGRMVVCAFGDAHTQRQWLRDVLSVRGFASVGNDGREVHVLDVVDEAADVAGTVLAIAGEILALRRQEEGAFYHPDTTATAYWWTGKPNFGDVLGPQLVQALTGRQIVQQSRVPGSGRVLYSVGSTLGFFRRGNVDVWGSGLKEPLTSDEIAVRKELRGVKVHAVRGLRTQEVVKAQLGWDVPDVYGDPGLLTPRIIPASVQLGHVAVVPHYYHLPAFAGRDRVEGVRVVDVRTDARSVAREISGARAVVSSSLHGLILAQAYGVPWVWLSVTDHPLSGSTFKFEDFFSTIDAGAVSSELVSKDGLPTLNFEALARQASLPETRVDLDELQNALPVSAATSWSSRGSFEWAVPSI